MKHMGRWLLRLFRTALLIVLVLTMLPWASELVRNLFPEPLSARTVSEILSREMHMSRRLETCLVQDEGVLVSSVEAFLVGSVQSVKIHYTYTASIGINMENVAIQFDSDHVSVLVPQIELLTDSLIPNEMDIHDFWYPLTESRRRRLLAEETEKRPVYYLSEEGEGNKDVCEKTIESVRDLVLQILEGIQTVPVTVAFNESFKQRSEVSERSAFRPDSVCKLQVGPKYVIMTYEYPVLRGKTYA